MYIKQLLCLILFLVFFGCKEGVAPEIQQNAIKEEVTPASTVALQFINEYIQSFDVSNPEKTPYEWVKTNPYATETLKKELKDLYEEAEKQDSEMRLDFDPILDAQDNPDEFEVESADNRTGYIIVRGKEWKDFRLAMILKQEKGKWLVDGCGVVNIPKEKRIAR